MKAFLVNGYLLLKPSQLAPGFHKYIYNCMEADPLLEKSGNNCLPALPGLNQVYEDPVIKGAIQSILGKDFGMHPHKAVHLSPPGKKQQEWHRDSFWGYHLPTRYPLPWMIMGMYYPQETTLKMGPTGAKAATQYFTMDPKRYAGDLPNHFKENASWDTPLVCPEGSVCIIHYDLIHKGLGNDSQMNRYMFKFQFYRNSFPVAPDWNCKNLKWTDLNLQDEKKLAVMPICHAIWEWMCGQASVFEPLKLTQAQKEKLINGLDAKEEWVRFNIAFQLSLAGELDKLIIRLSHPDQQFALCAATAIACTPRLYCAQYSPLLTKLVQSGSTNDCRGFAIWILSEWGFADTIQESLKKLLTGKQNRSIRIQSIQAAGKLKACDQKTVDILSTLMLSDNEDQIRMLAAMALNSLGPQLKVASLKSLTAGLNDYHRYIQAYSLNALLRMGTPESTELAIMYLTVTRWCPITTSQNTF